jgi:hypothetical protein
MMQNEISSRSDEYRYFPGICPSWDNEARRPNCGHNYYGSTPDLYGAWLRDAANYTLERNTTDEAMVFVNAWNEWAEGAYLEPDRHYGFAYLAATRRALDSLGGKAQDVAGRSPKSGPFAHDMLEQSKLNKLRNKIVRRLPGKK